MCNSGKRAKAWAQLCRASVRRGAGQNLNSVGKTLPWRLTWPHACTAFDGVNGHAVRMLGVQLAIAFQGQVDAGEAARKVGVSPKASTTACMVKAVLVVRVHA